MASARWPRPICWLFDLHHVILRAAADAFAICCWRLNVFVSFSFITSILALACASALAFCCLRSKTCCCTGGNRYFSSSRSYNVPGERICIE